MERNHLEGDMNKSTKDWFQYGLGILVIVAFLAVLVTLIKVAAPLENKDALLLLLGVLAGQSKDVTGYFFGSSKGSNEKTEIMSGKPN